MWATEAILNSWGDKIAALAELASGDDGVCWDGRQLEERRSADPRSGIYSARSTTPGWKARCRRPPASRRCLRHGPPRCRTSAAPVRELSALPRPGKLDRREGRTIHDFGQNAAGYVAFDVRGRGGRPGDRRACRDRRPGQRVDNRNYRSAEARIEYVLKGDGARELPAVFHLPGLPLRPSDHRGRRRGREIESVPISSVDARHGELRAAATRWSTGW